MKQISKVAGMLLVALVCASAARAAGVLDQVPANAWAVVKVNHLQQTSDKVAKWAEQLGLAQMVPGFADPVGMLEKEMKISKGLDTSGEMALVVVDPDLAGGENDKAMMVLLPAKDFKALTGNFKNYKAGSGKVGSFVDENGTTIYISDHGAYAAFSPSEKVLAMKPGGALKLTAVIAKEMADKDIVMFANIPAMKEKLLPKLKEAREKALEEVERGAANFGAKANAPHPGEAVLAADKKKGAVAEKAEQFKPVSKAIVNEMFDGAEQFMNDSTGATFSVHLNDEGLNTSLMADFAADSYLGKFASSLKNTDADLLKGLPARKYFAYGGAAWNSEAMSKVLGDVLDPLTKALAEADTGGKDISSMVETAKQAMSAMKSISIGYTVPTGALGADSIIQAIQIIRGDSKVIGDAQKKNFDMVGQLLKGMPAGQAKADMEITEGAKTIGGVKLDGFKVNVEMDENNPQAAQAQQALAFAYGPNGISGYMGAVDPKTFLVVMGGTDKLLADAVAGAKANQDVFAKMDNIQAVSKQLPADKVAVEYIDLAQIITTGVKYAQGFNMQIKLQLPANLPPIGIAAATDGSALRLDSHVPTSLIQSVVAAGMQTYMQMLGGGGNAGNPDGL